MKAQSAKLPKNDPKSHCHFTEEDFPKELITWLEEVSSNYKKHTFGLLGIPRTLYCPLLFPKQLPSTTTVRHVELPGSSLSYP